MKYYLTTPLYYVNDKPHIGHAYTQVATDVMARWKRLEGNDVFFLTGTDEHGQKIERTAQAAGKEPKAFCDSIVPKFKDAWKKLDISYDHFIRTTDPEHEERVQSVMQTLFEKGDIYKGTYEGWYCTPCETYWTDLQLEDGKCASCGRDVEKLSEETYYFRLSAYQDRLLKLYEENPGFIAPDTRRNEVISRVSEGLRDLSVSRLKSSLSWGVPFPVDDRHTTYVWFDALLNYITGVQWPGGERFKYWPADLHIIGKDILWFHAVIWPAMLMALGVELPKRVFAHGFWTVEGEKMSKSKGNFLDPLEAIDNYGLDAFRYFLLREVPFGQDGDYSESALAQRNNTELADAVGNLVMRVVTLLNKYTEGKIPPRGKQEPGDGNFIQSLSIYEQASAKMEKQEFDKALDIIVGLARNTNKYIQDTKPWVLAKEDTDRLNAVLYNSAEAVRILAIYLDAFIPDSAAGIRKQLNVKPQLLKGAKYGFFEEGHEVGQAKVLFKKLEAKPRHAFERVDLRAARIVSVEDHPEADKLYVLRVDLGSGQRTIVAGIKPYYEPAELEGKTVAIVANLEPAKLRGILSEGMLLAAEKDGVVGLLSVGAEPGTQVIAEGIRPRAAKKISFKNFGKLNISVKGGKAFVDSLALSAGDKPVTCERVKDGKVE